MRTLNKKLDALTHENATLTHAMRTQRVDDALERRLRTLQEEKVQMENALEREQECMMHRLTSVLENLGRENQSVSKERDRLSFETARRRARRRRRSTRAGIRSRRSRWLGSDDARDSDGSKGAIVAGCNLWYNTNKTARISRLFGVSTRFCRRWFEASATRNLSISPTRSTFDALRRLDATDSWNDRSRKATSARTTPRGASYDSRTRLSPTRRRIARTRVWATSRDRR